MDLGSLQDHIVEGSWSPGFYELLCDFQDYLTLKKYVYL